MAVEVSAVLEDSTERGQPVGLSLLLPEFYMVR